MTEKGKDIQVCDVLIQQQDTSYPVIKEKWLSIALAILHKLNILSKVACALKTNKEIKQFYDKVFARICTHEDLDFH